MRTNQIARKEKVIHKLERLPAKKIPIVDFYNPKEFKQPERKRAIPELSADEREERALLLKRWSTFVGQKKKKEEDKINGLFAQQKRALEQLEKESPSLYAEAIKYDMSALNISCRGPVLSLPRPDYKSPLGGFKSVEPPNAVDSSETTSMRRKS